MFINIFYFFVFFAYFLVDYCLCDSCNYDETLYFNLNAKTSSCLLSTLCNNSQYQNDGFCKFTLSLNIDYPNIPNVSTGIGPNFYQWKFYTSIFIK